MVVQEDATVHLLNQVISVRFGKAPRGR